MLVSYHTCGVRSHDKGRNKILQWEGTHVARPLPNEGGHTQEARPDGPSAVALLRLPRLPAGQGPPAVMRGLIVTLVIRGVLQQGLLQGLHGALVVKSDSPQSVVSVCSHGATNHTAEGQLKH